MSTDLGISLAWTLRREGFEVLEDHRDAEVVIREDAADLGVLHAGDARLVVLTARLERVPELLERAAGVLAMPFRTADLVACLRVLRDGDAELPCCGQEIESPVSR